MDVLQHPDLLLHIFKNLTHVDLCHSVSRVNRLWYQVSIRNELWRFLCFHVYSKHHGQFKEESLEEVINDDHDHGPPNSTPIMEQEGVNLKSNPDEFLNRNIVRLELEELYYKNKFFEKAYSNKFRIVLRYPREDLKLFGAYYNPVQASEIKFSNDVKHLLKFVPILRKEKKKQQQSTSKNDRNSSSSSNGGGKKKQKKAMKFELIENPNQEELLELFEFPGLITCSEMNRVYCVLNACLVTKDKNFKRNTYDIVKKYIVKRSLPKIPMSQRWEYVMNEQFSSYRHSTPIKMILN